MHALLLLLEGEIDTYRFASLFQSLDLFFKFRRVRNANFWPTCNNVFRTEQESNGIAFLDLEAKSGVHYYPKAMLAKLLLHIYNVQCALLEFPSISHAMNAG